ncbi:MAG: nickel pincer cofactor biosynthesis protein LarC [Bacillaceae bacterium]|nr:nickel pincer cofactor biosynthesis protein LarC [Bacillaceae bacterium]
MKILYFDCFSGISGDMVLGALVDAGADPEQIQTELKKLPIEETFHLTWKPMMKKGVSALKFDIEIDEPEHEVFGHDHHHHHHHHHRHYTDIIKLIKDAGFEPEIENRARTIFEIIGKAEAKIHNIPLEKVHFHEVGALDSILDIVGASIALHQLKIDRIMASPVAVGSGYVPCDHGMYPIPAPATLEILKNIPLQSCREKGELTTPTGAGILAATVDHFGELPSMTVKSIGYGAGSRDLEEQPNVLRVMIGNM